VAQAVQMLPGRIAAYRRRQQINGSGRVHQSRVPGRRAAQDRGRRGSGSGPGHAGYQSGIAGRLPGRDAGAGPAQGRVTVPQPLAVDDGRFR